MRKTLAARDFLPERVPDEAVRRILENARFAPSDGNRQGRRVIAVKDPEKHAALKPLIIPTVRKYPAQSKSGEHPFNTIVSSKIDAESIAAQELQSGQVEGLVNAPALSLVLIDLSLVASMDQDLNWIGAISGASIYPLVSDVVLAARNEGLGGTLTTLLVAAELEVKKLFDTPDRFALSAMLPIGKPRRQLRKLKRKPVRDFAPVDSFTGPVFE